jgi:hypothetical protein
VFPAGQRDYSIADRSDALAVRMVSVCWGFWEKNKPVWRAVYLIECTCDESQLSCGSMPHSNTPE